jgi:phosphoglycerol transferase MdoB-like AlkP superfamily enzyme
LLAGVLVVSAVGFALSVRDAIRAHQGGHLMPWLTALASGFSASGVRMFRVFAVLGCLHSVNAVAAYVQGRSRVYLVRFGERVLEAT